MRTPDWDGPLSEAYTGALTYLAALPERPVRPAVPTDELRERLGGPLPRSGTDPRQVVAELAALGDAAAVPSGGGRYFGFVTGGAMPAAMAADWLTATWDQNSTLHVMSPLAGVAEEVAGRWLTELLGLPGHSSVGFVTGAQMANVTGLAIGLRRVLLDAGWDVDADGLFGAPPVRVVVGEGRHSTVDRALRLLGLGSKAIVPVAMDDEGRLRPDALELSLAGSSVPVIVAAQLGNVNTGALDPVGEICDVAHRFGAWVHVDGAFGLWAAASPTLRHSVAGVERADSWATDAHKWLNVPYDSGLVFCAHPEDHAATMGMRAGYLPQAEGFRDSMDFVPESSRRCRGFAVHAAIRSLGADGVGELVDRCCALARRFADGLRAGGAQVLNDVVLNQVLVRFGSDENTSATIASVQSDGTCWMGGTSWQGRPAMRVSVSNWSTDEADVDASVAAVLRCAGL
ncbi:pyridoxal phosphate-dependent decarboxylase family protein [Spongisporangium articulatum]|uniref:Pyridoxal phosphate-dependent decarboxylase family protein n=1 Tax=Spongisporangium articulatum TaxID=3362603 RepID=A0ABW8AQM8_9ACTN